MHDCISSSQIVESFCAEVCNIWNVIVPQTAIIKIRHKPHHCQKLTSISTKFRPRNGDLKHDCQSVARVAASVLNDLPTNSRSHHQLHPTKRCFGCRFGCCCCKGGARCHGWSVGCCFGWLFGCGFGCCQGCVYWQWTWKWSCGFGVL